MDSIDILRMYSKGLNDSLKGGPENLSKEEVIKIHKKIVSDLLLLIIDSEEF